MDIYTPELGCQQKRDAAWTDIPQNRVVSKNVRRAGQGERKYAVSKNLRAERMRENVRNFRVFRFIKKTLKFQTFLCSILLKWPLLLVWSGRWCGGSWWPVGIRGNPILRQLLQHQPVIML